MSKNASTHKSLWMVMTLMAMLGIAVFAQQSPGSGWKGDRPKSNGPGVAVAANGSVGQVVSRIRKAVADNGMMVMGELHQGKVLVMTGLRVESETLFVGNPQVGKKLFAADPGAGIAVPIRINIYKNASGQTIVRYVPPSEQLKQFYNPTITKVSQMLDKKMHDLVSMLAK